MINFTPYDGDPFILYKDAVDRKRDVADKLKLQNIEEKVRLSYDSYQAAFIDKNVHALNKDNSYSLDEKGLLKNYIAVIIKWLEIYGRGLIIITNELIYGNVPTVL